MDTFPDDVTEATKEVVSTIYAGITFTKGPAPVASDRFADVVSVLVDQPAASAGCAY